MNSLSFLTIFTKSSILDVWQNSEFPWKPRKDVWKNLHLRYLAGSWICINILIYLCIHYFRYTFTFTKFDKHILPYIKQESIVHGQIQVTLFSTYLFDDKNDNRVSEPCVSIDYRFFYGNFTHFIPASIYNH